MVLEIEGSESLTLLKQNFIKSLVPEPAITPESQPSGSTTSPEFREDAVVKLGDFLGGPWLV